LKEHRRLLPLSEGRTEGGAGTVNTDVGRASVDLCVCRVTFARRITTRPCRAYKTASSYRRRSTPSKTDNRLAGFYSRAGPRRTELTTTRAAVFRFYSSSSSVCFRRRRPNGLLPPRKSGKLNSRRECVVYLLISASPGAKPTNYRFAVRRRRRSPCRRLYRPATET